MEHIPVMLAESLEIFKEEKISSFFDGTVGGGGFAKALIKEHPEIETYLACDQDENALKIAKENLKEFKKQVRFIHANFRNVKDIIEEEGLNKVDGFFLTWEFHQCN